MFEEDFEDAREANDCLEIIGLTLCSVEECPNCHQLYYCIPYEHFHHLRIRGIPAGPLFYKVHHSEHTTITGECYDNARSVK